MREELQRTALLLDELSLQKYRAARWLYSESAVSEAT